MARLEVPVLLRWSDLDAYQHVNNAAMLTLLEEARITAFWRAPAGDLAPWPTAVLDAGPTAQMSTLVARQEIEYLRPLSYRRTPVIVEMWLGHLGGASLDVCYEMRDPLGRGRAAGRLRARGDDGRAGQHRDRHAGAHRARRAGGLGAVRRGARRHPASSLGTDREPAGGLDPGALRGLGRAGDVALHAAEHDAVERVDRPPVELPEQALRVEQGALREDRGRARPRPAAPATPARARASRRAGAAAGRPRSPRRARSRRRRRRAGTSGRDGRVAAPGRRPAGPPARGRATPAPRSTTRARRRRPRGPARAPRGRRRPRSGARPRTASRRPSPGRSAAGRSAHRATAADDHRVADRGVVHALQGQPDRAVEADQAAGRVGHEARRCRARRTPPRARATRPAAARARTARASRGTPRGWTASASAP